MCIRPFKCNKTWKRTEFTIIWRETALNPFHRLLHFISCFNIKHVSNLRSPLREAAFCACTLTVSQLFFTTYCSINPFYQARHALCLIHAFHHSKVSLYIYIQWYTQYSKISNDRHFNIATIYHFTTQT